MNNITQKFLPPFHIYYAPGKEKEMSNKFYPEAVLADSMEKLAAAVVWDNTHIDFGGEGRAKAHFKGVDVAVFDFDNVHSEAPDDWVYPERLCDPFKGIPFIVVPSEHHMKQKEGASVGASPRPRFHVFFWVQHIKTLKEYEAFMLKTMKYFNEIVFRKPVIDVACKDGARFWKATKLSTPPQIYNEDGQENLFDFIARVNIPTGSRGRGRPANPAKNGGEVGEPIKNGERHNTMLKFAYKVTKKAPDLGTARKEFEARLKDLQEPLPQGEVEGIWESAVKKAQDTPFLDDTGKVNIPAFCDMVRDELHVKKIDGALFVYNDETGEYESGGTKDSGKINEFIYGKFKDFPPTKIWQVHHILLNTTPETPHTDNANLILFKNCVLDISTWKTIAFSPEFVIRNPIPSNYNPKAYSPIVIKFLKDITMNDADMEAVLAELVGASMYRGVFGKAVWLAGNGRNGKSVLAKAVEATVGKKNVSSVPMERWVEPFKNASLEGKTANIVHEAGSEHIKDTTYIKSCIRGERIDIEQKNQPTRSIEPYFTSWTASNEMPVIGYLQSQEAISDRFLIIPFDAHFEAGTDADDPDILEKLTTPEALEYWVLLGLFGLKRLLDRGRHTTCARIEAAGRERRHGADSISAWIDDKELDADYFIGQSTTFKYTNYKEYCEEEGRGAKPLKAFVTWICQNFRLISVQKRVDMGRTKVFEKKGRQV